MLTLHLLVLSIVDNYAISDCLDYLFYKGLSDVLGAAFGGDRGLEGFSGGRFGNFSVFLPVTLLSFLPSISASLLVNVHY